MYNTLSTCFNCVTHPANILHVVLSVDGDVHLKTSRSGKDGVFENASVRFRTHAGGGANLHLQKILSSMATFDADPLQLNIFDRLYPKALSESSRDFSFLCDDNPGSHLKIALTEHLVGFQTNCHDEEKNLASAGILSVQGDGAMVWMYKDSVPAIYQGLKACLKDGQKSSSVYGDRSFRFLTRECA